MKDLLLSWMGQRQSKVLVLLLLVLPFTLLLFYWCHTTNSLALTSFAYLCLFDIGSLLVCLVSAWTSQQKPNPKYSYGFERANVLSIFTITILLILAGLNLVKHCMESLFAPPVVQTENMLLGMCLGLVVHVMITCGVTNRPLLHATEAATPNWLQNVLNDMGHSLDSISPTFSSVLLQRLDPVSLLIVGETVAVLTAKLLIDLDELYLADVAAALFNSALICGTMMPLSIYTAKILLQTAPEQILPLLDKSLREASTLDGVLEIKNEHFWTIAFGSYAGSLHVRVRRDANEQEVLTQLTSRLASQMNDLTIQVVKDDWSVHTPSPGHLPSHKLSHSPAPLSPPQSGRSTPMQGPSHKHHHHLSFPHSPPMLTV